MFNTKKKLTGNALQLALMQKISYIDKLASGGFLYIDESQNRLVISTTLASLFISSEEKFSNFLQNVSMWMMFERSRKIMEKYTPQQLSSMEQPALPEEKPIDFCILTSEGTPIVVGNFKNKHLSMVPYDEVKDKTAE